jgi:GTPase SAR1 family protein
MDKRPTEDQIGLLAGAGDGTELFTSALHITGKVKYYEYYFNVLVLGDTKVGKSTLIKTLADSATNKESSFGFTTADIILNSDTVRFRISESTGTLDENKQKSTTPHDAKYHIILLMFDVNDTQSIANIAGWVNIAKQHYLAKDKDTRITLVGSKLDLVAHAPTMLANTEPLNRSFCEQHGFMDPINIISAKTDDDVSRVFAAPASAIIETEKNLKKEQTAAVVEAPTSTGCCPKPCILL